MNGFVKELEYAEKSIINTKKMKNGKIAGIELYNIENQQNIRIKKTENKTNNGHTS